MRPVRGSRCLAAITVAAALSASGAGPALGAPGDRDPGFSHDGLLSEARLGPAYSVAVQPDGAIVTAGLESARASQAPTVVARFGAGGGLDAGFGEAGITTLDELSAAGSLGLAIQPDGRILVGGTRRVGASGGEYAVARLLSDGRLDPSFGGGDGVATVAFDAGFDALYALALQADGRIVVAGTALAAGGEVGVGVARLEPGGAADSSFSADGRTVIAPPDSFIRTVGGVAVQPDGAILVSAGGIMSFLSGFGDLTLARLEPDGDPDPGFGSAGVVAVDFGRGEAATDLVLRPDGRIAVPGTLCTGGTHGVCVPIAAQFGSTGGLDPSFGDGGRLTPDALAATANAAALDPAGKLLFAGAAERGAPTRSDFALLRLRPEGSGDPGFSRDGLVHTDFGFGDDDAAGLAVDAAGRVVLAGASGGHLALARYLFAAGPADADADGLADSKDRCPQRYATPEHGCPRMPRKITIGVSRHRPSGEIKNEVGACIAKQKVKLKRVRRGPDKVVDRLRTNERGAWRSHERFHGVRLYARTPRSLEPAAGRCVAARSHSAAA